MARQQYPNLIDDLAIIQGETYRQLVGSTLIFFNGDLTAGTLRGQIRTNYYQNDGALLAEFYFENSYYDEEENITYIYPYLSESQTINIPTTNKYLTGRNPNIKTNYIYDIELELEGVVYKHLPGYVQIIGEITDTINPPTYPSPVDWLNSDDIGVRLQPYNSSTVVDSDYVQTEENYTTLEKNKLAGVAEGATVNSADAMLLTRANHTGTQPASTISDFDIEVSNNSSVTANTAKVSADGSINTHSDVDLTGISLNQILRWDGSKFVPSTDNDDWVGITNLSYTTSATEGVVVSDTGSDATIPAGSSVSASLMLPGDKTKLDGIESGATADLTGSEIKSLYEVNVDTNAYTDAEKAKLSGIAEGAEVNVNADWNAVSGDAQILNKPALGTAATTASTDYATAAQGLLADSALQPQDIGGTVQPSSKTVSTPPLNPIAGQEWWDSETGEKYIYYVDGDSGQWVQAGVTGNLVLADVGTAAYSNIEDFASAGSTVNLTGNQTITGTKTFSTALILPNNSRINGVEHFYQTTKPTTRGDNTALVIGDRWWKTNDGTEWFWNGTYWLSNNRFFSSGNALLANISNVVLIEPTQFGTNTIFVEKVEYLYWISSTDASNYYTTGNISYRVLNDALGVTTAGGPQAGTLFNTTVAMDWISVVQYPMQVLTSHFGALGALISDYQKVGSPGSFSLVVNLFTRLVAE